MELKKIYIYIIVPARVRGIREKRGPHPTFRLWKFGCGYLDAGRMKRARPGYDYCSLSQFRISLMRPKAMPTQVSAAP